MCGIFGFKLNRSLNESDLKQSIKHLNLLSNEAQIIKVIILIKKMEYF